MSIVIALSTYDGIIIAGDSRLTYVNENRYTDDSQKIFIMNHKVCITFTNNTTIGELDIRRFIRDYIKKYKNKNFTVEDAFKSFKKELSLSDFKDFDTNISLIGYDKYNMPFMLRFNIFELLIKNEFSFSFGYFANFSSPNKNEKIYINDLCNKYNNNHIRTLGVKKSINLCNEWIKTIGKYVECVGGPIDIILMTKKKSRWIKNKNDKHNLLSQRFKINFLID